MATKGWAIALMFVCTIFTSVGQLFYKLGANNLPELITNWQLLLGFVFYGLGLVLFLLAMRGGEVSVLNPIIATSYIWTNILAMMFLNENVSPIKWAGCVGIMVGISLIGLGSREDSRNHGN